MTTRKTLVDDIIAYNRKKITHLYCRNYHQFGVSLIGKLNNTMKRK